ncbi:hypothetical protein Hanom_Chr16g01415451 [Helianthus anomalus]
MATFSPSSSSSSSSLLHQRTAIPPKQCYYSRKFSLQQSTKRLSAIHLQDGQDKIWNAFLLLQDSGFASCLLKDQHQNLLLL